MADAYWRYASAAVDPRLQQAAAVAATAPPPAAPVKRPRPDFGEVPGASDPYGYYPREDDRLVNRAVRDTESIGASYDRYLRSGQLPSYGPGDSMRPVAGGVAAHPVAGLDDRSAGYVGGRPEPPLPADASNTLYVEGLPPNCSRREVSHIFRPFVGFQEVRLVNKESKHPGGEPLVLCFVDFASPGQAVVALEALQGYRFDLDDRESAHLRLQFARYPGPRSSGGPRGRR